MSIFNRSKSQSNSSEDSSAEEKTASIRRSAEEDAALKAEMAARTLQKRAEKTEREEAKREALQTKKEDMQLRASIENARASEARARNSRRKNSFAGQAFKGTRKVATRGALNSTRGTARLIMSQPRQGSNQIGKGIYRPVRPQTGSDNLEGIRQLGTLSSSSSTSSPFGNLSGLRSLQGGIGSNLSPLAGGSKLSPNQSTVFSAIRSGITENKEISNLTTMPIMQVARAKKGLLSKGLIKA
jgi:hypothetical protein